MSRNRKVTKIKPQVKPPKYPYFWRVAGIEKCIVNDIWPLGVRRISHGVWMDRQFIKDKATTLIKQGEPVWIEEEAFPSGKQTNYSYNDFLKT